jgi:hypothetical protein
MAPLAQGQIDIAGMSGFQEWASARGFQASLVPPEELLDISFVQNDDEALK